jgi:alkylation response protein AidB-like acyl-CoA dehydrogenase
MAEHHYKANMRDTEFNLYEYLRVQDSTFGKGEFVDMDEPTARESLKGVLQIAENEFAACFADGDRHGVKFDGEGNVKLEPGVKAAIEKWFELGWHRFEVPTRMGGYGGPPSVCWAGWEFVAGANAPIGFYTFGALIARIIEKEGTKEQLETYALPMVEKAWGGTMVLTEPNAGSDVGAGRSTAKHVEGDKWHLEGVKRFITNGDFDAVDNIIHLVLARPPDGDVGTKGLSCFIVPKYLINEDGSLGERNGVFVTNVEHKMGINASATCELTMGGDEDKPCVGYLLGDKHDGIRQMFMVIEQARMCIGLKSAATISTAYLNALEYAKERVQGPNLTQAMDKSAPRVRIIEHADVRRMLMNLKAHAEGMRAIGLYAAQLQDLVTIAGGHRTEEGKPHALRNDLLLPLVKGYSSDKGFMLLGDALQLFGGSGYCKDYPMEQYIRDQKIDSLYEGTTHIQALDLIFRKIARDGGETLTKLLGEAVAMIEAEKGGDALKAEREQLQKSLGDVQAIFGAMMGKMGESLHHVGLHANRILYALAETVIGWLLIDHAALALEKLEDCTDADKAFYKGKVASARFWAAEVLPGTGLAKKVCTNSNLSLMELDEDVFG